APGCPIAGMLHLEVATVGRQVEEVMHPGAQRLLLIHAGFRAHDKEADGPAILRRQHRSGRVDRHRHRVFPGGIGAPLILEQLGADVLDILAAGGAEPAQVERGAGRIHTEFFDTNCGIHGVQSIPPEILMAWPLMNPATSEARYRTSEESSEMRPVLPTG